MPLLGRGVEPVEPTKLAEQVPVDWPDTMLPLQLATVAGGESIGVTVTSPKLGLQALPELCALKERVMQRGERECTVVLSERGRSKQKFVDLGLQLHLEHTRVAITARPPRHAEEMAYAFEGLPPILERSGVPGFSGGSLVEPAQQICVNVEADIDGVALGLAHEQCLLRALVHVSQPSRQFGVGDQEVGNTVRQLQVV